VFVHRSYFSTDGIQFNFGRVPIAGSDFSTYTYTYDDVPGDTNFTHFNLTDEDFYYKVS
jgi:glucosylceramidase